MKYRGFALAMILFVGVGVAEADNRVSTHPRRGLSSASTKVRGAKAAPKYPHLDAGLNRIADGDDPLGLAANLGYRVREDRVQVVAVTVKDATNEVTAWLESRNATHVSTAGDLVQAFVPVDLLPDLAAHVKIQYVRKPHYVDLDPRPQLKVGTKLIGYTSEGLQAMNADVWHSAGFRGEGLKVAVIDVGFAGYSSLLGTELPTSSSVYWNDFSGFGFENSKHGTACAEIVYDLVPDVAEMNLFSTATDVDIVSGIEMAQYYGVNVISLSVGKLAWGPGDGTGIIADAIDAYVNAGNLISIAAGNSRIAHWQGGWNDPDENGFLIFATGLDTNFLTENGVDVMWVPAGQAVTAQLVWNQWSSPTTDLDLHIFRWDGASPANVVAGSYELQNGSPGQHPSEMAVYANSEGGYYGVAVEHWSGPTSIDIELIVRPDFPLEDFVQDGSVLVPADTASAISVSALNWLSPYQLEIT